MNRFGRFILEFVSTCRMLTPLILIATSLTLMAAVLHPAVSFGVVMVVGISIVSWVTSE